MKDILTAITELREQRNWTEYQLAERSGLPQSTISSWFRKGMIPTVPSLEKVCVAFGITLSQLRTPLCKISSTGEIEQRFRLN